MSKSTWMLVALVACAAIVAQAEGSIQGLTLARVQLFAFPLVALLFTRIRVLGTFVPAAVLTLSALSAAGACFYAYLHVTDSTQSFLVAQLDGDEFGIPTRALRDKLNLVFLEREHGQRISIAPHHIAFQSHADADNVFAHTSSLPLILWGTPRWLNLSFRQEVSRDEWRSPWTDALHLKLVSRVPIVGLAYAPLGATAEFLALLVQAEALKSDRSAEALTERELLLREIATSQAHWTSYAHRAYPLWELGNLYLRKAMELGLGASDPRGYLKCSIDAYTRARLALKPSDNPELLAAALNNRAVALLILSSIEPKRELRLVARKSLRAAARAAKEKNVFHITLVAPAIARQNLREFEGRFARTHKAAKRHLPKGKSKRHRTDLPKKQRTPRGKPSSL